MRFGAFTPARIVAGEHDLNGRNIIVTGGASGIGLETARALAGAGADVMLAVRDRSAGERAAVLLVHPGPGPDGAAGRDVRRLPPAPARAEPARGAAGRSPGRCHRDIGG